jgi:hypothetical protein
MTTNSNFRVKNGLEVAEQAVIDGITLSNSSGTFAAQIITAESTSTTANSSTVALIVNIRSNTVEDVMNSYNSGTPGISGTPTYSTDQTKFDDYSWNNEDSSNIYIEAYSGGGYDFSSMGSSIDWTIDMWIYTKSGASGAGNQTLVNGSGFGDGPNNIWFGVDNDVPLSGTLRLGNGGPDSSGPSFPGTEAWHHAGLMRKENTLYWLLNGETTEVSGNPTLNFGNGLQFLGGNRNNAFGLGYASRIRVAPATSLFAVGTYQLPVEADYDPAGGITVTTPASTINALVLDYDTLTNKPTPPDQSVDTNSNVVFNKVDLVSGSGLATRFIGYSDNPSGGTYLDLTSGQADINSDSIQFWSGQHGQHRATIDSSGFKIEAGNLIFPDNTTQSTAATGGGGSNPYGTTSTKLTVAGIDIEGLNTSTLKFSYTETTAGDSFTADVEVLARGAALDDESTNNYTITASGSAVAGSTGETNLEAGSFYSPGTTSDYITIDSSPSLVYGTGNFTIDFWLYTAEDETSGVKTMASDWTGTKWIIQGGNGNNEYYALLQGSGGGGQQFVYFDITPNQWNHIAIVRESDDTFKVYVDGVLDDTNTGISGKDLGDSGDIKLFLNGDGNQQPFPGYIEDFRITTAARYTGTFTPPDAASDYDLGSIAVNTASIKIASIEFADGTSMSTAATGGGSGVSSYSRLDLPTVTTGIIVLITDSSTDGSSPVIKDSVPAYYDTTDSIWRYVSNNEQVVETIVTAPANFDYLIVAGGGGGGAGGGGAGGMLTGTNSLSIGELFTVTVGAGGARTSNANKGADGGNSSINSIVAIGGGGGPDVGTNNAGTGGSGAGAAQSDSGTTGAAGTSGQGNAGGNTAAAGWPYPGAGGGGAGAVGGSADGTNPGAGGDGLQSDITGTLTYYAGGGGGAYNQAGGSSGSGGQGGGGVGSIAGQSLAVNGVANTGGGGGAGGVSTNGGNGGSGIVVIRFDDTADWPTFLTGTYSTSTYTGYKVISFTGSGTFKY